MTHEPSNPEKDPPPSGTCHETHALESLGIVLGEISHDFNNVLALVLGYVEMALGEIPEGQRGRSELEHVLAAGDRARHLVARIRTFGNRTGLKKQDLDLRHPLQAALQDFKDRLPPDVKLETRITPQAAMVVGNEVEIAQIVTNLCNNSRQALGAGQGRISVSLDLIDRNSPFHAEHPGLHRASYAVLTVTDNGSGMDASTLVNIYRPFFTTHRGKGRGEARAGLGLTTVANIVASMGGMIFVNSAPGEGTTFELCFPLTGPTAELAQPVRAAARVKREKNVLFIDDEAAITEMAGHILAHSGYKGMLFTDGKEALDYFCAHPHEFDVIITDLNMPTISGSEVATRCNEINPGVPVVLTSGSSDKISAASCREWGVRAVITKPFSLHELRATLEKLTQAQV